MKGNTPLAKTTVTKTNNNYLAVIPFIDSSSLQIMLTNCKDNNIQPCTLKDRFIYESLSKDIRLRINELIESMK